MNAARPADTSRWLAWFFVTVWGSGYLASKVGMQYTPPFTFLSLRFALGVVLVVPLALLARPTWPRGPLLIHVVVAGLLMHAINLGGSHYSQYLGMSAGITALILALQPLVTAMIAAPLLNERPQPRQWLGIALGLLGVALVVWHKIDLHALTLPALVAVSISLGAITAGTLYQRIFCPAVDLRAAGVVQFVASLLVLAPLAVVVEGFPVRWSWPLAASILFLVVLASILAVNALHTLMRRGQATRVTSLLYLTPIIAVALEWAMFGVRPTLLTTLGIAITCAGVALVAWRPTPVKDAERAA
ncbi:MAG TPA: EamA family transporter [Burkholderiaceae bacterium]|nr:EamA family transporter [Burkholderiaceae bacterium]